MDSTQVLWYNDETNDRPRRRRHGRHWKSRTLVVETVAEDSATKRMTHTSTTEGTPIVPPGRTQGQSGRGILAHDEGTEAVRVGKVSIPAALSAYEPAYILA